MSSRKEEERNERIIRGLMKLPPNRRCINCDSLGPQYVCTNFWTFICTTCGGIHREFTHRVKSVSMAKFTAQEVEALQRGGNQRARELFLKDWDVQRTRLPDGSNAEKIREFIRNVYVDKKYAGGRPSDKPPRDTQSLKNHEDHRRASSYHSFSQSPPYEHQYEDRRYGKQSGMLSRKPGSDRGHSEGKISSFMFSPGRLGEQMHEDNFANESCGSRISDYSVSGRGDPFRSDGQSPNFQDTGLSCQPLHQVREIVIEDTRPQTLNTYSEATVKRDFDGIPRSQRTASLGSFGSSDGSSAVNSGSLIDIVLEPEHAFPSSHSSASANSTKPDLFNLPTVQQPTTSLAPPIDLFAGIKHQASFTTPSEQETLAVSVPENVGWATFDLPHHPGPAFETNYELPSMVLPGEEAPKRNIYASSSMHNSQWFPVQNSAGPEAFPLRADQWHVGMHEVKGSADPTNFQSWNAFDDSTGNVSQSSFWTLPQNSETKVLMHKPSKSDDPYTSLKVSEISVSNGFQKPAPNDNTLGLSLPFNGVAGSSFAPFVLPLMEDTILEQKSTNPFDLLYDSGPEPNDVFLGMRSLQEALPNPQLPWFTQNSIPTYIPSMHQGELAYIAGQVASSQLPNAPPQGPVASLGGGNPFA